MPKIQYVGVKKDGETAFFDETGGITWYPGTVKTIDKADLAARMLRHPDVFALTDSLESDGAPTNNEVFGVADELAPAPSPEPSSAPAAEPDLDAPVVETPTANVDESAISLAPGGTVAAAPEAPAETPAPAPAPEPEPEPEPTPAPTAAPKPAKKAAAKKPAAKKTAKK